MAGSKICMITLCPEKSAVRITDGYKRLDVCRNHLIVAEMLYKELIKITEFYDKELENERRSEY